MAPPLSPRALAVRPSTLAALLDAVSSWRGEVFPFHIGDMAKPPHPLLLERASELARDPAMYRYGHPQGEPALRNALASHLGARHGLPSSAGHLVITVGATGALSAACASVLSEGDDVLACAPYWPIMRSIVEKVGARLVEVDVGPAVAADPRTDIGVMLRRARTPRTRAIYVTAPNNPDGMAWSAAQRQALAHAATEMDLWVIEDMAYADFRYVEDQPPLATWPGMAERTLSVGCFSKSWAMTGMRVGWLHASPDVIAQARKVSGAEAYHPTMLAQHLGLAALELPRKVLDEQRDRSRDARDVLVRVLAPLEPPTPEGGAYVFLDAARWLAQGDAQAFCLHAASRGVLVAPGHLFGASYQRHLRLNFTGMPVEALERGGKLLVDLLRDHAAARR